MKHHRTPVLFLVVCMLAFGAIHCMELKKEYTADQLLQAVEAFPTIPKKPHLKNLNELLAFVVLQGAQIDIQFEKLTVLLRDYKAKNKVGTLEVEANLLEKRNIALKKNERNIKKLIGNSKKLYDDEAFGDFLDRMQKLTLAQK